MRYDYITEGGKTVTQDTGDTMKRRLHDGARVRLVQEVENYPVCIIKAGETGTLMRVTEEGTYWVRLDAHHPELAEWDNELEIWDWSSENPGLDCHPEHILALADNEVAMCQEYQEWCRMNHLPAISADELLHEKLTAEQRKYVSNFINRWEVMFEAKGL